MNLFRSEEHVLRWSLYQRAAEDYIMPVAHWARIFSGPLFRERLEPEYLAHAQQFLEKYHADLKEIGKASPYWQYPRIVALDTVRLQRYAVVGDYTRYDETILHSLKDACRRITEDTLDTPRRRRNHLLWAAPGSGKTYFVEQIARHRRDRCTYAEVNLAKLGESTFRAELDRHARMGAPGIILFDEVDAQAETAWPYEALLPFLDTLLDQAAPLAVVMAGSSGSSLDGLMRKIEARPKGKDLVSRVPAENRMVIPALGFGDRVLVVLSQIARAAREAERGIRAVEKLGLYYVALSSRLSNARQLYEFAVRAVSRVPQGEDRLKYDNLFEAGDPDNKRFFIEVAPVSSDMIGHYVWLEP